MNSKYLNETLSEPEGFLTRKMDYKSHFPFVKIAHFNLVSGIHFLKFTTCGFINYEICCNLDTLANTLTLSSLNTIVFNALLLGWITKYQADYGVKLESSPFTYLAQNININKSNLKSGLCIGNEELQIIN